MTQLRERTPSNDAQHFVVAPLALRATGTELALDEPSALDEALERLRDDRDAEPVTPRDVRWHERPMRPRKSQHEIADGIRDRLEKSLSDSGRQRHAERVAISTRIFGCDPTLRADDRDFDDAAGFGEFGEPLTRASRTLSPLAGRGPG